MILADFLLHNETDPDPADQNETDPDPADQNETDPDPKQWISIQ